MRNKKGAAFAGRRPAAAVHINHYAFAPALVAFLITGVVPRQTRAETNLAAIARWVSAEGFAGELNGAPVRALGYEAGADKASYRGDGTVHLFYVTNSGGVLLGHVDAWTTILLRFDGPEVKATAHGDMVQRKMWQEPNSVHAELLAKEVSYWTDRWNERLSASSK